MNGSFDSTTIGALTSAMHGLALRQLVSANNVANAETPGFLASKVEFESRLREALAKGRDPGGVVPAIRPSPAAPGPNGNNVELDKELVGTTGLHYQTMVEALNFEFRILRSAING